MGSRLFVAAGFAVLLSASAPSIASPLSDAKTIQVHETVRTRDGVSGEWKVEDHIDLRIARPDQINALITTPAAAIPSQYAFDGKTEREYYARSNSFRTVELAKDGKSHSASRQTARVDLILSNGQLPPPKAGVQRTVGAETRDNIPMTVTMDVFPPDTDHNGVAFIGAHKLWIVTETGLPYRYAASETRDGKTTETYEETFTDWRFDQPLTPAQMAFAAPADAKPYVEPTMPAMTSLAVGVTAPDFSVVTPEGKTVHLSDFKGKTVVLDFWATWCHPCQMAMPHLDKVYQQVQGQNVAVLGVCIWDKKESYDKWVADKKAVYSFPTAFDPLGNEKNNIGSALYNMNAIPTQYVIDKNGKIAAALIGYDEGDNKLENALAAQGVKISAGDHT